MTAAAPPVPADALDAAAWAVFSDWLEEFRPGKYEGRVWVPNPAVGRARTLPILFADAEPRACAGLRFFEWTRWDGERPNNRRRTHEVMSWLFALLRPHLVSSYGAAYRSGPDAQDDLRSAALRWAAGACAAGARLPG